MNTGACNTKEYAECQCGERCSTSCSCSRSQPSSPTDTSGDPHWLDAHAALRDLHVDKSSTYGTGGDKFRNFTAVGEVTGVPPERYALLRIIEKATRALNMIDAGRAGDVQEYPDIAGLGLCCEALRRRGQETS